MLDTSQLARENFWLKALNEHLAYLRKNSWYYKDQLVWAGPEASELEELSDIENFPFTEKDDIASRNEDFLCVPKQEVRDIVTTSGTLGHSVACYLTEKDLKRLGVNEAGSYRLAGCTKDDTFQLLTTIDKRFMAGLAYFLGSNELGARMIRSGPGALQLQWESIARFEPTVLIAVPSFIPKLIDYARNNGIDPNKSSVKKIICIGEAIRDADLEPNFLAKRITEQWNVQLFSTYASTEMATAFTECEAGKGAHLQPELMFLEVLDEDGNQVKNGESGEVVVTPLGVEGTPVLRFRTGDICHYYDEPCSCGRTTPRLGPVVGRKQQMVKLKGTSLYPNAIIDELNAMKEVVNFVVELHTDDLGLDEVVIKALLKGENAQTSVLERLGGKLRVKPRLILSTNDDINSLKFNENERKPKILIDRR
ncbi:MAG: AMP-binding protein [Flavobacteriales bacterium]|nr:AMP-binding protein [Flavobacteriales bacterium]MCB9203719.1 AMP-binding protein [Flavobacteriales bacterium]